MSTYSSANGNNNGGATTEQWGPETPFLADVAMLPGASAEAAPPSGAAAPFQNESPFVAEYEGESDFGGPRAQVYAELVGELSDTEFSEALEDLVNEAAAVAEDRFSSETGDPAVQRLDGERAVRGYLAPIARAAEEMLDGMSEGLSGIDLASASESEMNTLLERFTPPTQDFSPVADQFLGGLLKKAKGAIRAVKSVASKVASVLPVNLILGKLKALVRPLLERVLRLAINRIPVALQPIAKQLAARFLGITVAEASEEMEDREEAASVDPAQLEHELDSELAGYVLGGERFEQEAAIERAVAGELAPTGDQLGELARCRKRFAHRVTRMQPSEDVQPAVEEFVPAILAALRIGINIIGRPKVVKFLAGLVANLIKKYVGEEQAMALSGALVDAGLRMVSLETQGESGSASGYALGATVEDTITRLVQDAPAAAWESEELLTAYTYEAFQEAASAHFPDSEIRDQFHEAAHSSGVWTMLPERSPNKTYKRYSRVLTVTITPQAATSVKTFGGVSLRAFLSDRLGVETAGPLQARAHLFEAIPGTTLGLIALHEKGLPGLGTAGRRGRSLLHPLTPAAASTLFGEPGLAHPVAARFLARRGHIKVGQRFYFLEIPGARVRVAPRQEVSGARPARSSQPKVVIDLVKREIRLFLFFSEGDAQKLTAQVRQQASVSTVLASVNGIFGTMIKQASGDLAHVVKIVHESAPTESHESAIVSTIKRTVGHLIGDKAREWMLDVLKRELGAQYQKIAAEIERATADEADGVTICITLQMPLLEKLRALYKPTGFLAIPGIIRAFRKARVSNYQIALRPGFAVK